MNEEKKMRSGAAWGLFANLKGRCEVLRALGLGVIRKAVLSPVLPTERVWNPPRGRGAVLMCRTRFSSLLLPPRSEPLMHAVHWQLLRCCVPGICYNIHHLWCAPVQLALLILASSTEDTGSSSSPSPSFGFLLFWHWHRFRWHFVAVYPSNLNPIVHQPYCL